MRQKTHIVTHALSAPTNSRHLQIHTVTKGIHLALAVYLLSTNFSLKTNKFDVIISLEETVGKHIFNTYTHKGEIL
jgi:hypothetical protein